MMFMSPEFKVGALVLIISGLIGTMSLKVAQGPGVLGRTNSYWFNLDNAGGLIENSAVKAAGIKVGVIDEIEFVNGKAKVTVRLDKRIPITSDSFVEIRSDGILGDKHVELMTGDTSLSRLSSGSKLATSQRQGSLDGVMDEVSHVTQALSKVAESLNRAIDGNGDNSSTLGRIIINLEELTQDLKDMTGDNKGKINEIVDSVHSVTASLDNFMNQETGNGFKPAWGRLSSTLDRMDRSMKNIEQITSKLNNGEGTLGRLINDEETIEELNVAIHNVNDLIGDVGTLVATVDFHSEYLSGVESTKSILNFKIQPGLDRFYEIGIVDDPKGLVESTNNVAVVDGGTPVETDETKTFKGKVKFNAMFAKNFYDFTIRGGILESSGGVGFDYHFFRKKLKLSLEAFNFSDINVRGYLRYNVVNGVYLLGGGDNMLSKTGEGSAFVGAGIFFTNDDLKLLASKMSF